MQLEEYFDFLAPNDIRIKGHRIGIESILYEYVYNSKSAEEMVERFPTLSLAQIYATILYYLQNEERLNQYLADWLKHGEQKRREQTQNPTPTMLKLRQKRSERDLKREAA